LGAGTTTLPKDFAKQKFVSKVLGLADTHGIVEKLNSQSDFGYIITTSTPFYAEGGGQVGDLGVIKSNSTDNNFIAEVLNCTKSNDLHIHHVKVIDGELKLNSEVELSVDITNRKNIMANHSATHLLHSALRSVLGTHITQAGSLVDASKTRFDFTHNKPLTQDEIFKIESLVNQEISSAHFVAAEIKTHKQAIADGAMALFGEKYGDTVRVLSMGDFSSELCGGTHVSNTSQIQLFKITSESGVSSGVRRIEAITGERAVSYARASIELLKSNLHLLNMDLSYDLSVEDEQKISIEKVGHVLSAESLRSETQKVEIKINKFKETIKDLEKEIKKLKSSQIDIDSIISKNGKDFSFKDSSGRLVVAQIEIEDRELLAQLADQVKNKISSGVVVFFWSPTYRNTVLSNISECNKKSQSKYQCRSVAKSTFSKVRWKGRWAPRFCSRSH
jgi:alanyl-tRNA synthetase